MPYVPHTLYVLLKRQINVTYAEFWQVINRISLLPSLGRRLHFRWLTVQIVLRQGFDDAGLLSHECSRLFQRHSFVEIAALDRNTETLSHLSYQLASWCLGAEGRRGKEKDKSFHD